ncbi:MAG: MFS transporter [Actinomycetota bacterium]|nr:MFS transporter [Actinomycetota bacterium]
MADTGANNHRMEEENGTVTGQQWRWTVLASMASYIDAGSIVALGVGLALWQEYLGLSNSLVGTLAAIGPNALGAAVGAFVGGRLGDLLGRKRIYQYDLLVYALGIALIALSVNAPMLFIGTVIVGVAVGADVPTSLALIGEFSPSRARGRLIGLSQVAWSLGPIVVFVLAFVLSGMDLLGIRIVFAHLFVVAIVTWALRRGMVESARWTAASGAAQAEATSDPDRQPEDAPVPANPMAASRLGDLFSGPILAALLFTGTVYLFWNLAAGTYGIFFPYILRTLGTQSQAVSVALSCLSFVLTLLAVVFIFMPFSDRSHRNRRLIFGIGAAMQILAFVLLLVFPFTIPVIFANIALFGIGGALAGEPFYKVWSQELFPTMLRGTAQGFSFGVARTLLGIWSFFVPVLSATGIRPVALLLTIFLTISGVVGFVFMPNTAGKTLEEIEEERSDPRVGDRVPA